MDTAAELQCLYSDYLKEMKQLSAQRRLFEGILGFGKKPGKDICNRRFYDQVDQLVSGLADSYPDEVEAEAVVETLLHSEERAKLSSNNDAKWMFIAIQGHALKLIPFLSPKAARELLTWYQKAYRPYQLMPVQRDVITALKRQL